MASSPAAEGEQMDSAPGQGVIQAPFSVVPGPVTEAEPFPALGIQVAFPPSKESRLLLGSSRR